MIHVLRDCLKEWNRDKKESMEVAGGGSVGKSCNLLLSKVQVCGEGKEKKVDQDTEQTKGLVWLLNEEISCRVEHLAWKGLKKR